MKRTSILTLLALFTATLTHQGAVRAQGSGTGDDWGQVVTSTSAWTHITEGSTTGFELKDDRYFVSEDLTFTNTIDGDGKGSGMHVQAGKTVHLYIPKGVTLTTIGADAKYYFGGGAGILVPEGSTLHILGEGTLVAKGGKAANGESGSTGQKGELDKESVETWIIGAKIITGAGGHGGYGGGGAGAGIGTAGGNGGAGGVGPAGSKSYKEWEGGDLAGTTGTNGNPGATAAAMGTVYIQSTITQQISGGAKGNGGAAGRPGNVSTTGGEIEFEGFEFVNGIPIPTFGITDMQAVAGGGGGGGGAGGGSAKAIGTGGAGGGGGASGASGSACAHDSWTNDNWGSVGAGGGTGGIGTDDNNGKDGYTCWFEGDDNDFDDKDNHKPGGAGGAAGSKSVAVAASAATAPQFNVNYYTVATTASKTTEAYSVGSSTKITLPTMTGDDGDHTYKWILSIYGNEAGQNTTSHCAGPNGDVYAPGATVDLSNIYGDIEFCAVYVGCEIDCAEKVNMWWNMGYAHATAGKYAVVDLKNRKLYKDGYWNTLTLPFSLSAEKLATTCLAGADIRTFKSASWDAGNQRLTINFSETNDGEIKAGTPCIIRWGTPEAPAGGTIQNPSFTNVEVTLWDQADLDNKVGNTYETQSNTVRFEAMIGAQELDAEARALFFGSENKLYKPNDAVWVLPTRAYFSYTSSSPISLASELVLDFGGDEEPVVTTIDNVKVDGNRRTIDLDGIFNLNGQRLSAPQKGLNIINGKKVVIK